MPAYSEMTIEQKVHLFLLLFQLLGWIFFGVVAFQCHLELRRASKGKPNLSNGRSGLDYCKDNSSIGEPGHNSRLSIRRLYLKFYGFMKSIHRTIYDRSKHI